MDISVGTKFIKKIESKMATTFQSPNFPSVFFNTAAQNSSD